MRRLFYPVGNANAVADAACQNQAGILLLNVANGFKSLCRFYVVLCNGMTVAVDFQQIGFRVYVHCDFQFVQHN